jgi:hypothetical protein
MLLKGTVIFFDDLLVYSNSFREVTCGTMGSSLEVLKDLFKEYIEEMAFGLQIEVEVSTLGIFFKLFCCLDLQIRVFPPKRIGIGQYWKGQIDWFVLFHKKAQSCLNQNIYFFSSLLRSHMIYIITTQRDKMPINHKRCSHNHYFRLLLNFSTYCGGVGNDPLLYLCLPLTEETTSLVLTA